MSTRDRLEQSLLDFGKQIGESLELDDDRTCVFELSDDHECLIAVSENGEAVTICVNVAPVEMTSREALFRHLLVMNYQDEVTEGATLGLTEEGDEIVLRLTRPGEGLDSASLERLVGNLATLAERLGAELMTWQEREAAAGGAPASSDDQDDDHGRPSIHPDYA